MQVVSSCCGKCGCPILQDEPHKFYKGIPEHINCEAGKSEVKTDNPGGKNAND